MFQSVEGNHQGVYIYQKFVQKIPSKIFIHNYIFITCSVEDSRSTLPRSYNAYIAMFFTQQNAFKLHSVGRVP
jgi:hypothetical protein